MDPFGKVQPKADTQGVGLSEIFRSLATQTQRGTLRVTSGERLKMIYFGRSQVAALSREPKPGLGERLLIAGRISDLELEQARTLAERGASLTRILLDHMLIIEEEVVAIEYAIVMDEIYDLFYWPRPHCEFLKDYRPEALDEDPKRVHRVRGESAERVLDDLRSVDEWEYITQAIPSVRDVFAPVNLDDEVLDGLELEPHILAAAEFVDGRHSVEQIAAQASLSELEVSRLVYELLCFGAVEILSPTDIVEAARAHMATHRYREAFDLYTLLAKNEPENTGVRWRLAECAAQSGLTERAVKVYDSLREHYAALEDKKRLYQVIQRILELAPERRRELSTQLRQLRKRKTQSGSGLVRLTLFAIAVTVFLIFNDQIFEATFDYLVPLTPGGTPAERTELAARYLRAAEQAEERGNLHASHTLKATIARGYAETPSGKQVYEEPDAGLPATLVCLPEGLQLDVAGRRVGPLGSAPHTFHLAPGDSVVLTILDGETPVYTVTVDPWSFPQLELDLRQAPNWIVELSGGIEQPPVVLDGLIYALSRDGHLNVLDVSGYKPQVERVAVTPRGARTSPLVATRDGLFLGDSSGRLVRVEPDGLAQRAWRIDGYPVTTPPVPVGAGLLLASRRGQAGQLFLFRVGERMRRVSSESHFGWCTPTPDVWFGVTPSGGVFAYDFAADHDLWRAYLPELLSAAPLVAGHIFCLGRDGTLYALDQESGALAFSVALGEPCDAPPILVDDDLIIGTRAGRLVRVAGQNGALVWDVSAPEWGFRCPPTARGEGLYFATGAGGFFGVSAADGATLLATRWVDSERVEVAAMPGPALAFPECSRVVFRDDDTAVFGTLGGHLVVLALGGE